MKRIHLSLGFACAFAVAGCAQSGSQGGLFATPAERPKTIVVSDFVAASEVTATDNGFNTRLERTGGNYPILERRQRTLARVNDEIVATIVADLHGAGLDAQAGGESSLSFGDNAVLVSGRLRPPEHKPAGQIGFGPGKGNVAADMTLTRYAAAGRAPLLTFSTDVQAGRKIPAGNAKVVAARNQAIADSLLAEKALPEKLSPDVEAQARALGRAIAAKIVDYAREHDWLEKPDGAEGQTVAADQVRLPEAKPAAKPTPKSVARPQSKKPQADPAEDKQLPDGGGPDENEQ